MIDSAPEQWRALPSVIRFVKHILQAIACLSTHYGMAQLPDRAPSRSEALLGIDTTNAYNLDSVCDEPRHWALKRAYRDLSGTAIGRNSSGRMTELQQYISGIAHGRWYSFDTTGQVTSICLYDTASTTSPYVLYFPSGAKQREGLMYRPDAVFARIFAATAPGIHRTFSENGIVQELEYFEGNTRTQRHWYPTGQIASAWVDSAGIFYQKQWCPNGDLVGDMSYRRMGEGTDPEMKGRLVLAHTRSGETFTLKATYKRFVLKSDRGGERIVLYEQKELNRVLSERNLEEVAWDPPCEPRVSKFRAVEDP